MFLMPKRDQALSPCIIVTICMIKNLRCWPKIGFYNLIWCTEQLEKSPEKEKLQIQLTSYTVCPVRFFPRQNKKLSYLLKIIQVENNFLTLLMYLLYLRMYITTIAVCQVWTFFLPRQIIPIPNNLFASIIVGCMYLTPRRD